MPLPAETTRSAWAMGVSAGMPTVKSCPSFFRASTKASTLSFAPPSRNICPLRTPVIGAGFLAAERPPPPLESFGILPIRLDAITTRWISLVPSYIVVIFASRYIRSTSMPFKKPVPPKICIALFVTSNAMSDAYILAIAASIAYGLWASFNSAAEYTRKRAQRSFVAISASLKEIPCWAAIGFPNWTRSLA